MEDEHLYDYEFEEQDPAVLTEQMLNLRRINLGFSIADAFTKLNATQLRQWYVETFVLDSANHQLLGSFITEHQTLERLDITDGWQSIEHQAIGHRLLLAMRPRTRLLEPSFLRPDDWRSPDTLAQIIMKVFRPWDRIRFDPETENWFRRAHPGQWIRMGKGRPGEGTVERHVAQWLTWLDHANIETVYGPAGVTPVSAEAIKSLPPDQVTALMEGSAKALKKFTHAATSAGNVRKVLEREPLMWLDSSTLNRIRTMAPFSNGMLALVPFRYEDTEGNWQEVKRGQLLPMHEEFMVTNANSLMWQDKERNIIAAAEFIEDPNMGKHVADILDDLLLQCPTYWSFLTHAFPDTAERSAFLRLMGAAMYGTNLKIVAAMIGEPNAGKDTVINWLNYLMPGQVASLPFSAFTAHGDDDRGFAPLMGARVATVSGEVGEGRGSKLLAEKIKTVSSGGGSLRVAEKYEKPTTIFFDGMLFLQGNSVPTIAGGDSALYRNRLVAVEFKHPFPLQAKSYEAAYRNEAAKFAQLLFIYYSEYVFKGGGMMGIDAPESWKKFGKEFENAANAHGFIEQCIVPSEDPVPTHQFHAALSAMAERFGSPYKVGPNYWPKRIRAIGYKTDGSLSSIRRQVGRGTDRVLCYYLTVDASRSDGAFTQRQWETALADAAVTQ